MNKQVSAAVVRIETDLGAASGFVIDPDRLILTNNHVVVDAGRITVFFENGVSCTGKVQGRDLVRDLAVVKIEAIDLPAAKFGDVSSASLGCVGDWLSSWPNRPDSHHGVSLRYKV